MITKTMHGAKLAARTRCAAAAAALVLLPTAAGALTLVNDIATRLTYNLHDQTDVLTVIPCYQENMDNKGERQWSGFPPSCAGRIELRVKVEMGGVTCTGEKIPPNGTVRITGSTTSCSVAVSP